MGLIKTESLVNVLLEDSGITNDVDREKIYRISKLFDSLCEEANPAFGADVELIDEGALDLVFKPRCYDVFFGREYFIKLIEESFKVRFLNIKEGDHLEIHFLCKIKK